MTFPHRSRSRAPATADIDVARASTRQDKAENSLCFNKVTSFGIGRPGPQIRFGIPKKRGTRTFWLSRIIYHGEHEEHGAKIE